MKGLFQTALVATAVASVVAGPLQHRHHHHPLRHLKKRAGHTEVVTQTVIETVVDVVLVRSTIYVEGPPGYRAPEPATSSSSSSSTSEYVAPPSTTSSAEPFTTPEPPTNVILVVDPATLTTSTTSTSTTSSTTSTTVEQPSPTPEPVQPPPPAPVEDPVQEPEPTGGSSPSGPIREGKASFYSCAAGYGSCGESVGDMDYSVAIPISEMGTFPNPNNNPQCRRKIKVYNNAGLSDGIVLTIKDTCPGCKGPNDLDICQEVFWKHIAPEAQGIATIWWHYI